MKPFLLLATRAEDTAADDEYAAFLRYAGLAPEQLHRVRLERDPMPPVDLDDYSGIILGGGPFNVSDPPADKSPAQRRAEASIDALLDDVIAADFPFMGACYGVGAIGTHQGGTVNRTYGEPVGAVEITLTDEGLADPVFGGLPSSFQAFVGHKEAIAVLPPGATRLASSPACPVQGFRIGTNVYATQFHPELDVPGICLRIDVYRSYGYFPADEAEELKQRVSAARIEHPGTVLTRFVEVYASPRSRRSLAT